MELKFDEMTVDTSLAQEYLDEHTVLSQLVQTGTQEDVTITLGYKMLLNKDEIPSTLTALAEKLKSNTDLIAQLEYLIRNVPVEDSVAQLNVIIQQLRYVASLPNEEALTPVLTDHIEMKDGSPLLVLGYTAKVFQHQLQFNLYGEGICAPVCHLFTILCHSAGLPIVTRLYQTERRVYTESREYRMPGGTVGVISEHSDVDSAVDVFLTSCKQVPWKLQHIFVQESVYRQFKDALRWKCDLNKRGEGKSDASTDSFEYNGRVFAVAIEAYGTRKELKSLLKSRRPHYVSLWANDIAEINELAHSIPSPVVWVNSFGDFRGPPRVSEAVYSHTMFGLLLQEYSLFVHKNRASELLDLKQSWQGLGIEARREVLLKALDDCIVADSINNHSYAQAKQFLQATQSSGGKGAFLDVGKDHVCLGIIAPANELFMILDDIPFDLFLESLLQGNGFFYRKEVVSPTALGILRKAGAPIVCLEHNHSPGKAANDAKVFITDFSNRSPNDYTITTKVIWTNSGTVFAN